MYTHHLYKPQLQLVVLILRQSFFSERVFILRTQNIFYPIITSTMLQFLCEAGGDPDLGQTASSLHFAARFGRPRILRTLLRF